MIIYVIPVNSLGSETHKKKANLLKLFDKMAGFLVFNPYYSNIRKLSQRCCNLSLVLSISLFTSQPSLLFSSFKYYQKLQSLQNQPYPFLLCHLPTFQAFNCVYSVFNITGLTMKNRAPWVFS